MSDDTKAVSRAAMEEILMPAMTEVLSEPDALAKLDPNAMKAFLPELLHGWDVPMDSEVLNMAFSKR